MELSSQDHAEQTVARILLLAATLLLLLDGLQLLDIVSRPATSVACYLAA